MEALRSLVRKVRLESKLKAELARLFLSIRKKVGSNIRRGAAPPNTIEFENRLDRILTRNVKRAAKEFDDPVATIREDDDTVKSFSENSETKQINDEIANEEMPGGIKGDIRVLVNEFLAGIVIGNRKSILNTIKNDIAESIRDAELLEAEGRTTLMPGELVVDEQVTEPNKSKIARLAALALARKAVGRADAIAATITQQSSEGVKQVVRSVLVEHDDVDVSVDIKIWVTVGDDRVRATHVAVDDQRQPIDQPFELQGGQLMFPTDTSLGADISEIINCRCSSPPLFFNPKGFAGAG
jgi:hypothetical protein